MGYGGSPCCSLVAIADIRMHLYRVSTGWQTPVGKCVSYHVDHVFCVFLRLPTLDPGTRPRLMVLLRGGHPLLVILRLDSCIIISATDTTNFNHP